jgi:hypothetical protein
VIPRHPGIQKLHVQIFEFLIRVHLECKPRGITEVTRNRENTCYRFKSTLKIKLANLTVSASLRRSVLSRISSYPSSTKEAIPRFSKVTNCNCKLTAEETPKKGEKRKEGKKKRGGLI